VNNEWGGPDPDFWGPAMPVTQHPEPQPMPVWKVFLYAGSFLLAVPAVTALIFALLVMVL